MDSTQNLLERLEQLHRIGAALSRERDINHLLDSILEAAKRLLGADGGTLYRSVCAWAAYRKRRRSFPTCRCACPAAP